MANVWQKAFNRIFWKNRPNSTTPLGESKLLPMDASIDEMDDRILNLNTTKADQSDLLTAFKSVSFNSSTGVFTFTKFNDTTVTVDTDIEKIAVNFDYDDDPTSAHYQNLIITLDDGTVKYVDLSALLTQYEFSDSTTIHFSVTNGIVSANVINGSITSSHLAPSVMADINAAVNSAEAYSEESEAWAKGTKDGTAVPSTADQYQNNSKYYSELSEGSAEDSEAYAIGKRNGTDVTSDDPAYHNNSKYYAQQAEASLLNTVRSFNGRTGQVAPQSGDYTIGQVSPLNGATVGQVPIVTNVGTAQEPVYQFAMGLVSGGGIGTCSSIQPMSMAYLVVPNEGFSVTTGSYLSVIFSNDFVWLGTNSLRIAIGESLYSVQVNGQAPEQNKVYVKSGSAGIFVYDGTYFQLIGTSGGGHEILNASGIAQTQRASLQYKDAFVSDDPTNGRTIVENIKEVSPADYDSTTDEGIIVCDDGNDVPIGASSEDYVEVVADGVKTYATLLSELFALVDYSKITKSALLINEFSASNKVILALSRLNSSYYRFYMSDSATTSYIREFTIGMSASASDCHYTMVQAQSSGNTVTSYDSNIPSNGEKFIFYYGTSSTVINLKTDANYCTLSDGQTTVEKAITYYKDFPITSTQYGVADVSMSDIPGELVSACAVDGSPVIGPLKLTNTYRFYTANITFPNIQIVGSATTTIRVGYRKS